MMMIEFRVLILRTRSDLVDLAERMGIPTEDAIRQAAQLIGDASTSDRAHLLRRADRQRNLRARPAVRAWVAPRS